MTDHVALLVVGGGPAGHEAASAYRRYHGAGPVRVLSADLYRPYNRPPLSKDFLRGESGTVELPLATEEYYAGRGIDVVLEQEVVQVDARRKVVVHAGGTETSYDVCVIATGASPVRPEVDGVDHPGVLLLRSRADAMRLRERVAAVGSVIVVGSGFIGCEAAASLRARGIEVTVVSMEPVPQAGRLGPQVGHRIADWLTGAGIRLVGGRSVAEIIDGNRVVLDDRSVHEADLVLLAVGVAPNVGLAEQAGLETSDGRIVVNEHMATSEPDLYAAGDVARAFNTTAGRHLGVEHWGEALRMGEIAGANAAGASEEWTEVPGFWSEIGEHTVKYAAWGDGWDDVRVDDHGDGAFTAWYARDGVAVGVLTHGADDDYDRGQELVEHAQPVPTRAG